MMDQNGSAQQPSILRHLKRPDSLRLELLTIPEDSVRNSFIQESPAEISLGFRNVSYTVQEGIFKNRRKLLLRSVNGDFIGGELTAIMGPSGAGKTTLMNILAGYTTTGVTGTLSVNSKKRNEDLFRKQSCYIMQDDNLQPLLTVNEAMHIAAHLKLNPGTPLENKKLKIKEILEALGLWQYRKIRTSSLSGGQRKRLAIALELLKNPQIMFFDEPTSGLDSSTTKQCVMLLKQLAQEGRTIVCTIHQPSASVFEMFDHLYALSDGKCIYQGSIKGLVPYLSESNLHCPSYHNPADYLLEVATGEHGNQTDILVNRTANGLNCDWRKTQRDTIELQSIEHIDKMMKNGLVTPVRAPSIAFPSFSKSPIESRKTSDPKGICYDGHYSTSFFKQLYILIKRTFLILSRDKTLTISRILTHITIALFLGTLYFGIGKDASNVLNNFNFIFFTVMFLMMTAMNCVITTFPSEMPIIIRENFNRWYSLKSYYLAISIADMPVQMFATLLYAVTTYFMTAQPIEWYRIFLFLNMCILISLVAQGFGLFIGASMDLKNGVIFGPFFLLPFIIFSGFFVQLYDAHPYLQWLFHISYIKYGFEGLMLSVFGYDRAKMPCNADYCHYVYPKKFLEQVDMTDAVYAHCVLFLVGILVFVRVIAFIALYIQIRRRR
nr:ATP-binding cassette sub-family G member 1-like [Onthophagus taurus]